MPTSKGTAGTDVARKPLRDAIEQDATGFLEGALTDIDMPGITDFARTIEEHFAEAVLAGDGPRLERLVRGADALIRLDGDLSGRTPQQTEANATVVRQNFVDRSFGLLPVAFDGSRNDPGGSGNAARSTLNARPTDPAPTRAPLGTVAVGPGGVGADLDETQKDFSLSLPRADARPFPLVGPGGVGADTDETQRRFNLSPAEMMALSQAPGLRQITGAMGAVKFVDDAIKAFRGGDTGRGLNLFGQAVIAAAIGRRVRRSATTNSRKGIQAPKPPRDVGILNKEIMKEIRQGRYRFTKQIDATTANREFVQGLKSRSGRPKGASEPHPPYRPGTFVFNAKVGPMSGEFVQVFRGAGKRPGEWLMRKQDFDRLRVRRDAARLFKDWFALLDPPTHFRIVRFNRTVNARVGIASQHRKLGDGNGIQLQLLEKPETSWFSKPQLIQ